MFKNITYLLLSIMLTSCDYLEEGLAAYFESVYSDSMHLPISPFDVMQQDNQKTIYFDVTKKDIKKEIYYKELIIM